MIQLLMLFIAILAQELVDSQHHIRWTRVRVSLPVYLLSPAKLDRI